MKGILIAIGIVGAYVALQVKVLPMMGIETWASKSMSSGGGWGKPSTTLPVGSDEKADQDQEKEKEENP